MLRATPFVLSAVLCAACGSTRSDRESANTEPPYHDDMAQGGHGASAQNAAGEDAQPGMSSDQRGAKDASFSDAQFVEKATMGGMFEVESSRLALEKSSSDKTKDFAHMMIEDHGKANEKFASLLSRKNMSAPARLDGEMQQKLDALRQFDGGEFDRAYYKAQVAAHQDAVALFQRAARDCRDNDLKDFAKDTLPTLQMHLTHLQQNEIAEPK